MYKRVVIKIGTSVITDQHGFLDPAVMRALCDQIATIKRKGTEVILISSGAVGAGLSQVQISEKLNKVTRRQVLSSVGQITLMHSWAELFADHQLHVAQVLATKEDFRDRAHYVNMRSCFQALLRDSIIPVVNENDVISVSALMFTDNDELGCQVAAMMDADAFIILSHVDGLLDRPPDDPGAQLISEVDPADPKVRRFVHPSHSDFGRGGMHTKLRMAKKAVSLGIDCFIANGKKTGIVLEILAGKNPGTRFIAHQKVSNVKKWIAYQGSNIRGKVVINLGAENALQSVDRVSSLLPIGIIEIVEDFDKGDIIRIVNTTNQTIGLGIARYSSKTARENVGVKGKRALVHYDYLFILAG